MGSTPLRWVCGKCRRSDWYFKSVTDGLSIAPEPELTGKIRDGAQGTQVQYKCRTCGYVGWTHHRIARARWKASFEQKETWMKVGDLKKLLEGVPDDLPVLISGGQDHSYFQTSSANKETVGKYVERGRTTYLEWYGPSNASPGEEPTQALVLHHGKAR